MSETKTLLKLHDRQYLFLLPPAREPPARTPSQQPPARIRIDKHTPPVIQMILHDRKDPVAGPTAARTDRLPSPHADRRPVMNGDRLRTGDHDRVERHCFESMLVLLA